MDFDEKEFAVVKILMRVGVKECDQPFHHLRNNLGMIVQLNGHDAEMVGRRIGHDVGEIAIEGNEDRAEFLRLGDDDRVQRSNGKNFT